MAQRLKRVSRYPVVRSLGRGGMGEIYLARDPDLDRDVALKVLPPGDEGEDAALRLRHEARAAAALRHPNIVTVYEVGVDEDRAFIAMEFVDGLSLRQIFEAGEVTLEQLTAVGAGVARALEAAHRAGVLHRDIKPDNVMLDRGGGIKVVDFGIAHRAEGGAPSTSFGGAVATLVEELASTLPVTRGERPVDQALTTDTIYGTPGYMAPELIVGAPPAAASDVYALGVVLYEGLTGRLPYRGDSVIDSLTRAADPSVRHEPLAEARPDLPGLLVELVESMLRHDAEERPTPEAVAVAFAALEPSTARLKPVPMPARRRRWLVGAALAGTLATAAAAAAIASQGGADAEAPARDEAMPHRVAVAPITGSYAAWAVSAPSAGSVAEAVARLLDNVRGMSAVPIPAGTRAEQLGAAKTRGADLLLAGGSELALDPANGSALVLVDVATGREQHYIELAPAALEELIAGVTTAVARRLAPGPEGLGDAAAVSLELGLAAYSRNNWQGARLYFEQAVRARPDFARAWFYVAWARGWSGTMRESAREAADRAEKTARTPLERELARAVGLFNAQRYREAAPVATALVEEHPNNIDVLYTAAEALFHDGQIAAALELFDRCLEIEPRFQPAASHPHHAALARGDIPALKRYASLIDRPFRAEVAYLSGNDEEALRLGLEVRRLELINRDYRNADAEWGEEASVEGLAYRMIRAAQQGRRDLGGADFARSWPALARAASEPRGAYALGGLVQALIIAEYPAPLRTLQRWWDRHETPSNLMTGAELAMFAAPLLGGRDRPGAVSSRLEEVGRALAAEADGRPGVAADILAPLVAQPVGGGGDNLIRHAHLRALARAGRRDELIASCRRWDRPGTWSMSSLALRDYCDRQRAAIQR